MEIKSFKDLMVWKKSLAVVKDIYLLSIDFPGEEKYVLTPQIRRSAISIPSNIAEGYGRNSKKDYIRFLQIAKGSMYELKTQLEIANNLNYISNNNKYFEIEEKLTEIDKMLYSLIKKLK